LQLISNGFPVLDKAVRPKIGGINVVFPIGKFFFHLAGSAFLSQNIGEIFWICRYVVFMGKINWDGEFLGNCFPRMVLVFEVCYPTWSSMIPGGSIFALDWKLPIFPGCNKVLWVPVPGSQNFRDVLVGKSSL